MATLRSRVKLKAKNFLSTGLKALKENEAATSFAKKNPAIVVTIKKVAKKILGANQEAATNEQRTVSMEGIYNPNLATNYAEHETLLQDNKQYWYEKEVEATYQRHSDDPRVVAIYLPQFHPFAENDKAWGKGFTEWTNVTASTPRFVGQQQPVLPADLGFYDLRTPGIMKQQIDLAKKYGVYGFQFYYYWFSGKKVMELPVNTLLENPDWDFNFSICWANENWTRKWDGGDNDIIFEQKNNPEDPLNFIKDVAPILNDPRYITEDGMPILTVYRVELLDDPANYVKVWREYFRKKFNKELWLIGHTYSKDTDALALGFNATMDFTPIGSLQPDLKPWVDERKYLTEGFRERQQLLDVQWRGEIIDFRFIAKQEIAHLSRNNHFYRTISPSWSNEARRKGVGGYSFQNSSPEIFTNWLDKILHDETVVRKKKSPIVFINAWNEWAEAAMLEPSAHMGHNSLVRIAETISRYSSNKINLERFPAYRLEYSKSAKLAVVIHLFYPDMWQSFSEQLKNITVPFDLYLTVPSEHSAMKVNAISSRHKNTNVISVPNRGRDVLPFLTVMNRIRKLHGYEYVLKLHTKKSKHRSDGDQWLNDVLSKLVPEDQSTILETLSNKTTGVIGPKQHIVSLSRHMGGNRDEIHRILGLITEESYEEVCGDESKQVFIGSTMFWCRLDLLAPILDAYFVPSDFQSESGQIDGTAAHAIERILGGILHKISEKKMYLVDKTGDVSTVDTSLVYTDKYTFAD